VLRLRGNSASRNSRSAQHDKGEAVGEDDNPLFLGRNACYKTKPCHRWIRKRRYQPKNPVPR